LGDVLRGLVCWVRTCSLSGQFCNRCGRFIP